MLDKHEKTFIMVKPDGVQRGFIGKIITKFEQKGYKLVSVKFCMATEKMLQLHYNEHVGKKFFPNMLKFMMSAPVCAMVWEGLKVVETGRKILGKTNPLDSEPGTIRGDYGIDLGRNICHASDSVTSAENEIKIWFSDGDLIDYTCSQYNWLYE
ncbi:hypothetical protein HZS_2760 [Henneguya salminicola]|uniref:Nucleoside diphosphate kinase n=1 Tax=Henneguya salminicola TaxID=69463 RepID=A0A6G3MKC3_HENSL|nr:hypothetical protein HZS_2760 [Henneguya salminicola]